jgi:hypothetical protein
MRDVRRKAPYHAISIPIPAVWLVHRGNIEMRTVYDPVLS